LHDALWFGEGALEYPPFARPLFFVSETKRGEEDGRGVVFGGWSLLMKKHLEKSRAHLKTIGNNQNKKRESIWCIFLFFWFCFWKPGGFFVHVNILDV